MAVFAQIINWTSPSGGAWQNPFSWEGGVIPGAANTARFNLANTYAITWTSSTGATTTAGLQVVAGNVSLRSTGGPWLHTVTGNTLVQTNGTLNLGTVSTANRFNLNTGTLTLQSGGTLLSRSGSILTSAGAVRVGQSGAGTLNVESGGVVSNTNGFLGVTTGSTGVASVIGSGSLWNNSSFIVVGDNGNGTLNVANGGVVTSSSGSLGRNTGSTGAATVTGTGSHWNNFGAGNLGGLAVGNRGNGTLDITNGGLVSNTTGFLGFWPGTTGVATVTGAGSRWSNSSQLRVGETGSGTLNIANGGVVTNTAGYLGINFGSTGVANVTGSASRWNNSVDLHVGNAGNGTLNVQAGGVVSNTVGYLGTDSSSSGSATVTGTGSQWSNGTFLHVGHTGNGTLNVASGGVVSSIEGNLGRMSNSTGTATVTGTGSRWNNSTRLYVGREGNGTLQVHDGGVVSNTFGSLGHEIGSTGDATVTGAGSHWNNFADLTLGAFGGNGTLNVASGGLVSNATGYVGFIFGSTGLANVTGDGARWTSSADLILGGTGLFSPSSGSGTVTIADGGVVSVGGTTRVHGNNPSTINLQSGGTLITHNFNASGGGRLNFTGGTLQLTGGSFVGNLDLVTGATLAGVGTVTGNLTLAGALDPGNSPGTLNVQGDLTWNGGGEILFDLGAIESDLINISGDLLQGAPGSWNFHFADAGDFAPGTYTLLTFNNTEFSLSDFSFSSDISGFGGSFQWGGGGLQFDAVPEPSSLWLVSCVLGLAGLRRRG